MENDKKQQSEEILGRQTITEVIRPRVWGPSCWAFLHQISLAYPLYPTDEDKTAMHQYFHALKKVLPCHTCKVDFAEMLDNDPIEMHLQSRKSLYKWVVDKHNQVNAKTGGKPMTFEDAVIHWTKPIPTLQVPRNQNAQAQETKTMGAETAEMSTTMRNTTYILVGLLSVAGLLFFILKRRQQR